ncbi:arylamine N-acetyltransferase [Terribacillus saccharophilus]|uniref:arylamine N-acetyltransferase family protein n=1 Tax=Terribacillus saccharophilus TaxID=361277 RepID=UPI003982CBA5
MQSFKEQFQQRINMNEQITFSTLPILLQKFAETIPFENLRIIDRRQSLLSKEDLQQKILIQNEGGVCYELNTLLYHYLKECGFDVLLLSACIYDQKSQQWSATGNTHAVILLKMNSTAFIVDAGFGANIPLAPLPMSGEVITTSNGQFRIKPAAEGYLMEMKLEGNDSDWRIGYRFSSEEPITEISGLEQMQQTIENHPASPFNKSPLVTKRNEDGRYILTAASFTEWHKGVSAKRTIDEEEFKELLDAIFGMQRS